MQATLGQSNYSRNNWVSLGQNHGYRFEGDTAILNAELAIEPLAREDDFDRSEHWALQLWACEAPHEGGPLRGIKVAEAALALPPLREHDYLETAAFAQLPPAQRAYSMVLVLASGTAGAYDQVHDFSNYPARQEFAAPHLDGSVGYRLEDDAVVLQAEGVRNPRDVDNISGSLSLELWALRAPYAGGAFEGLLLASAELERLAGQSEERAIERRVPLAQPPVGEWQLALMLREWTEAAGYLTRDFCNFASPYRGESTRGAEPSALPELRAEESYAYNEGTDVRAEESYSSTEAQGLREEAPQQWTEAVAAREEAPHVPTEAVAAYEEAPHAPTEAVAARAVEPHVSTEAVAAREEAPHVPTEAVAAREEAPHAPTEAVVLHTAVPHAPTAAEVALPVAATIESTAKATKPASPVLKTQGAPVSKVSATAAPSGKPAGAARVSNGAAKKVPVAAVAPTEAATAVGTRVSVQTGSADELATVPGLNKKLAVAIVRARPFASLDDLRRVRGIGDKMLQQLRTLLTL
ncbi:MAG: hypothetical protein RLZZ450_5838 [Pseudomonadota bacterium]|jgi:DNA uptake protein ComE-like DNA-binding protein